MRVQEFLDFRAILNFEYGDKVANNATGKDSTASNCSDITLIYSCSPIKRHTSEAGSVGLVTISVLKAGS